MTPERLGLLWGVTVFAGAGARLLAAVSGLPGVVLLLLSGLLIGRSGLGLVEPLDLGRIDRSTTPTPPLHQDFPVKTNQLLASRFPREFGASKSIIPASAWPTLPE